MQTKVNGMKSLIGMLIGFIALTVVGFVVGKAIEPKLQIQQGRIIDYELQENMGHGRVEDKPYYITIYTVQDDKTGEISQIREQNIMLPYSLLMGFLPLKHIVYSTYSDVALYNIMIGWKVVGVLGILVSILFLVKNPHKNG